MRSIFLLLLTITAIPFVRAQNASFERLTIEHGLSQGMVFDILQTRDGFLWFATKDGLNRYDGYNFKVFSNDPFDPFSLADNAVNFLFEDSRGWLWIGTESKGIDLYDRRKNRFHHFLLNSKLQQAAGSFYVRNIVESRDGNIWLVQQGGGLVRISIPAAWKTELPDQAELYKETAIKQIPVAGLDEDREHFLYLWERPDGDLTLISTARQYRVDRNAAIAAPEANPALPVSIVSIANGAGTAKNTIWAIGDTNKLFRIDGSKVQRFQASFSWLNHPCSVQDDGAGHLWLIFGGRLWRLSAGQTVDLDRPDWEIDHDITCITTDRNGNLWVGTTGYGLRRINPKRQLFHAELPGHSIWRLWKDPAGDYFWRDISIIYRHVPGRAEVLIAFPEMGENRKLDLLFTPDGRCWTVGARLENNSRAELFQYSADRKLQKTFTFDVQVYDYMLLKAGSDGSIWITGANCQLIRFDPRTARFDYYSYASVFGDESKRVQAFALAEDGNGTWWIGTQRGLVKSTWRDQQLDFQLFQADPQNPGGLNNNTIACLLPDPAEPGGVLWIGTKGGGINRLDIRSGAVTHLSIRNGLPDKVVYGILSDGTGALWCSTNRGLARIKFPHGTLAPADISTFTAAKGLQDNEFNTQAYFKTADGELIFGGVNGMNRFAPAEMVADTVPPPVFLVGLEINHQPVIYGRAGSILPVPVEYLQALDLQYDQNNVSFEFAALNFTDPAQNRYRYRMTGLDADWVETGGNRFAHFTHLAPGRYEFRLEGSNGEGAWQAAGRTVVVIVHPPWYRSSLAYAFYLLLLAGAGWRAYRFQLRRVQERQHLAYEQREIARVKAMERAKDHFFSNITHEFRTPLTLIIEPARRIFAATREPAIRENARYIETSSQRLLSLVNQLLDIAKIESGSMGIDLRQDDLEERVREVFRTFLSLAEQRDIRYSLKIAGPIPPFAFDAGKVEVILNNLISNALKFTPAGGKVVLDCSVADPGFVRLTVRDSGVGIPAEALEKVFERFYQVDGSSTRSGGGTGIGLALSRELVELMGGSLRAESAAGGGASFTCLLPTTGQPAGEKAAASRVEAAEVAAGPAIRPATAELPCVLLIEDNAELRTFIRIGLAPSWQVVEAANGQEGVEKALEILPDLVISDVMMPVKDGFAVCDELKNNELSAHIPIILLTAKSAQDARIKGLRTGADDYLTKPFNSEELLIRMENLVANRRRLRERYSRAVAAGPVAEQSELLSPPDREFLRRFTLLVDQHLADETIGVEELARKMLISRVQLHRKLKAITDRNVTDFVRDYRLDRALSMLRNREGRVYEVAARVGFGSEKYFSRAFKEKFGMPPSQAG